MTNSNRVELLQQDDGEAQLEGAAQFAVVALVAALPVGVVEQATLDVPVGVVPLRVADDAERGVP